MTKTVKILSVLLVIALACCGCIVKKADLYPDVSKYVVLGQYTGIEVDMNSDLSEGELLTGTEGTLVNAGLAEYVETDRTTVELGDKVNIDYAGTIDGVAFEGGTSEGYDLVVGSGTFIAGFEDQLIGANVGKSVTVSVVFPETYTNEEVAGKDAEFAVKINSIQDCQYEELTDEMVKENFGYDTVDAFNQAMLEALQQNKLAALEQNKSSLVLSQVIKNSQILGYPEDELEQYKQSTISTYQQYATAYGMTYEDFLSSYLEMSVEAFEQYALESAESSLKQELVLQAIANAEQLTFTSAEYNEYLSGLASSYGYDSLSTMVSDIGNDVLQRSMLLETALQFITDNAVEVY